LFFFQADKRMISTFLLIIRKKRGPVHQISGRLERVPLYFKKPGRGIRPGRNDVESINRPVVCGGVLVVPGDIIGAGGDGVVVVPRAQAERRTEHARRILEADPEGRRELYKKAGLKEDLTIKK
jgi:4-hydroxy-4-methyl-2-oxoglutarate aldolase